MSVVATSGLLEKCSRTHSPLDLVPSATVPENAADAEFVAHETGHPDLNGALPPLAADNPARPRAAATAADISPIFSLIVFSISVVVLREPRHLQSKVMACSLLTKRHSTPRTP